MITKRQYVEYLVSTPKNCTCPYLAEHLEGVSHDVVNDFPRQKRFRPGEVWKLVKDRLEDSKEAVLIVDDGVHDKRYSRFIVLVRAHLDSDRKPKSFSKSASVGVAVRPGQTALFFALTSRADSAYALPPRLTRLFLLPRRGGWG